jgi:hypothetical protein
MCIVGVIALYAFAQPRPATKCEPGCRSSCSRSWRHAARQPHRRLRRQRWSISVALAVNGAVLAVVALFFIAETNSMSRTGCHDPYRQ